MKEIIFSPSSHSRQSKWQKVLFFLLISIISFTPVFGQTSVAKGVVVDKNNEPIIGATVKIVGSSKGTITDLNGKFTLSGVPANGVLQVSYVGFEAQKIEVKGSTEFRISLKENNQQLDEIVVVGYGVQKKTDVTGALTRVTGEELNTKPVANAFQALQGKAAGVDITSNERPGEIGSILIRGQRSLNATNEPLYVVDGIPLNSGGIESLNPRDIESVDILKDASSTAIYGSRGANGVVLITTKRGKAGSLTLNYSGSVTVENIHDLNPSMSASDYITWRRWAYYNSAPTKYTPGDQPTMAQDQAFFAGDAVALANVMKGWDNGTWNPSKVTNTDWSKFVTQTGITQEHSISASGGTDKMRTSLSFGYLKNEGTQKGQAYERYNTSITTDLTPVPWFNMGGAVHTSWAIQDYGYSRTGQSSNSGPTEIYAAAKGIFNYALPYDENGNIITYPGGASTIYTVMDEWNKSTDNRQTFRALGSFYANLDFGKMWKPLNGLSYKINFGPDFRYNRAGVYIDSKSAIRSGGTSYARWQYDRRFSWTLDNQINYGKKIDQHNFNLTLLQTASKYNDEGASMSEVNVPKASYKWNNMGAVDITSTNSSASMGTSLTETAMTSYMARLNYSFKDRYLLTASGRYDGASMLAAGNKWEFFPSAALGWRIDQEDFLKDVSWIDQLKARVGMGTVGNSAVGAYATLGNIQSFYVPFGGSTNSLAYATNEPYYTSTQVLMANPDLTWEKTTSVNYGLDFSFFKGRINGSLEYYHSNTKDLLLKMKIPTLTGYAETWANVGETKNDGIEVSLTAIPVKVSGFEWSSTINAAHQLDEIVSLANGKQDMIDNNWLIGQSISIFYGYKNAGLWQTSDADEMAKFNAKGAKFEAGMVKPVDQNGDYVIDKNDRVVLGNQNPRWTLGWSNTFSYKGIELSVELFGRFDYMISTGGFGQTGITNQTQIDYWTPSNTDAKWQKPIYNTSGGDPYSSLLGFQKASFIKFRNVSLGYVFPAKLCKTIGLNNLKVYGQLKNPGTLYSTVDYIDLDLGTSYFNRGFTLGLQVGF